MDIGCGEGANVRMVAQKSVFAVGLDRESLAVQNARQFAIQEGLNESAQFLHSDALILPLQPFFLMLFWIMGVFIICGKAIGENIKTTSILYLNQMDIIFWKYLAQSTKGMGKYLLLDGT